MSILNKYPEGFCIPNAQVSFDAYRHIMKLAEVGGAAQRESEGATMFNFKAHDYFGVNMDGRLWHSHHKGDFSNNLLNANQIAELIKTEIPIMDAANDEYAMHKKQNEIMKEALMEIRNRGRKWPDAGEIAKNALEKAKEQGK